MHPRLIRRIAAACLTLISVTPAVAETLILRGPTAPMSAPRLCAPVSAGTDFTAQVSLRESFRDDFDAFDPYGGVWTPHFDHNRYDDWRARTLTTNEEQQIYVDPRYRGSAEAPLGLDPFRVENGVLSLVATPTPPEAVPHLFGFDYVSGMISSRQSFLQRYGYFEVRARLPAGQGTWPAFWLLRPGQWPPELDVLEARNGWPVAHGYVHWSEDGVHRSTGCATPVEDPTAEFHAYGLLWMPQALVWYVDRQPVGWARIKPGLNRAMYLLVNLAIGGRFPGPPDATTPFPAAYEIDWIAVYALDSAG
jgi:beta-glucanase (GH16 family)